MILRTSCWGKPAWVGVYVSEHLSFACLGKTSRGKPRSKPESGNPTFRERVQEKASVLSGRQTHQGKSQRPCSWDSREERNRISDAYRQSHLQDGEQAIGP